jgi:hypothetical protein
MQQVPYSCTLNLVTILSIYCSRIHGVLLVHASSDLGDMDIVVLSTAAGGAADDPPFH